MAATVIAVTNQKGGVGKTTTATNLSAGLAKRGKKVLLVDFDSQSHCAVAFGVNPEHAKHSLSAVFANRELGLHDASIDTYIPGLILVPADPAIRQVVTNPLLLSNSLRPYADQVDYCIIDTPPDLGQLTMNCIICASTFPGGWVLVPMRSGIFSLEGFAQLLTTLEEVSAYQQHGGGGDLRSFYRVLLTMVDKRMRTNRRYTLGELENFREQLLETQIRSNEDLNTAQSYGKAIFDVKPRSTGAEDYMALCNEVLAMEEKTDALGTTTTEWVEEAQSGV